MARKRFNKDEKEIIASGDTAVEWQNVTQWHPAKLTGGIVTENDGWQHVTVINLAGTRTVMKGETIDVSPGHLRRRQT